MGKILHSAYKALPYSIQGIIAREAFKRRTLKDISSKIESPVTIHEANTINKLKKAFLLKAESYKKRGYTNKTRPEVRVYNEFSSTLIAQDKEAAEILGTMSIFYDKKHKLPLDEHYGTELDLMRKKYKIAEIGSFAVNLNLPLEERLRIAMELNKGTAKQAKTQDLSFVIGVNPKHVAPYIGILGMEILDKEVTPCNHVNGAPQVLLTGNAEKTKEFIETKYKKHPAIIKELLYSGEALNLQKQWNRETLEYFKPYMQKQKTTTINLPN